MLGICFTRHSCQPYKVLYIAYIAFCLILSTLLLIDTDRMKLEPVLFKVDFGEQTILSQHNNYNNVRIACSRRPPTSGQSTSRRCAPRTPPAGEAVMSAVNCPTISIQVSWYLKFILWSRVSKIFKLLFAKQAYIS